MTRVEVLSWDWREQPDLNALARIVREMSDGRVQLTAVEDTGCDQYALILADRPYGQPEATETFLRHWRSDDG